MLIEDTVAGAHLDLVTGICQRLFSKNEFSPMKAFTSRCV
jgi:hypothetical protein